MATFATPPFGAYYQETSPSPSEVDPAFILASLKYKTKSPPSSPNRKRVRSPPPPCEGRHAHPKTFTPSSKPPLPKKQRTEAVTSPAPSQRKASDLCPFTVNATSHPLAKKILYIDHFITHHRHEVQPSHSSEEIYAGTLISPDNRHSLSVVYCCVLHDPGRRVWMVRHSVHQQKGVCRCIYTFPTLADLLGYWMHPTAGGGYRFQLQPHTSGVWDWDQDLLGITQCMFKREQKF